MSPSCLQFLLSSSTLILGGAIGKLLLPNLNLDLRLSSHAQLPIGLIFQLFSLRASLVRLRIALRLALFCKHNSPISFA